jgi:predicted nuclease of restriction endonuclease-like (RecB) superfamily
MPRKSSAGRKPASKTRRRHATPQAVPAIVQQPAAETAALPLGYPELLEDLKGRVRTARVRAAVSVNRELVLLYWEIGRSILERQQREGWGAKVIDRLADDLRREFPEMKGFSGRNLKYMKTFGEAYPDGQFVQEVLAQITWYHNITLLEKVKDPAERAWYVRKTVEQGWSRAVLVHQIETGLYARQGQAQTNFERTLPAPQSDLAQQLLKDPYCFDFLTLADEARERELQRGLVERLRDFLIELGVGFAFVGSLYHLSVGGKDYYLDLLFYHLKLRCFVVIELKVDEFEPEHAGKMSFYLSAVDDLLRHAGDAPSIGLILCKTSNRVVVEYALRDTAKPMGVATYEVRRVEALPEHLKGSLPTPEELVAELEAGGEGGE